MTIRNLPLLDVQINKNTNEGEQHIYKYGDSNKQIT